MRVAGRPYAVNANLVVRRVYLAGQVAQAALRAGGFIYSFSSFSVLLEVLTVREEEVGGVATHAIDILKPHTNKVVVASQRQIATTLTTTLTTRESGSAVPYICRSACRRSNPLW